MTNHKTIPGEKGLPFIGHTLRFAKDCNRLHGQMTAKYGPVYYNYFLGKKVVHLLSPEGNEFVLLDRDNNFSSRLAWNRTLSELFPNGLMLRDGDEHRTHRRLMGAPFKSAALSHYVDKMNPDIHSTLESWQSSEAFLFHPAIKQLTLDLAAKIFVGETLSSEIDQINTAFVDTVEASMAIVRSPMFGNKYQRGLRGRKILEDYFSSRVQAKRRSSEQDMFSEICAAEGEEGEQFSDQDVIDHMIFLMMAAHDTTTSSLSSVCYALAKNPLWQDKIVAEITALNSDSLDYSNLGAMQSIELVFREALRLYPPLPIIPRFALNDCEFEGYKINQGEQVVISTYYTHRLSSIWSNPAEFDPERFSKERAEDRKHRHAWVPFGGGAHKCIGLKFAELQIKLVLFHLLKSYRLEIAPGYQMPYQPAPIGKPTDGLPLKLVRR